MQLEAECLFTILCSSIPHSTTESVFENVEVEFRGSRKFALPVSRVCGLL
jgi:hypothetical protein